MNIKFCAKKIIMGSYSNVIQDEIWTITDDSFVTEKGILEIKNISKSSLDGKRGICLTTNGSLKLADYINPNANLMALPITSVEIIQQPDNGVLWIYMFDKHNRLFGEIHGTEINDEYYIHDNNNFVIEPPTDSFVKSDATNDITFNILRLLNGTDKDNNQIIIVKARPIQETRINKELVTFLFPSFHLPIINQLLDIANNHIQWNPFLKDDYQKELFKENEMAGTIMVYRHNSFWGGVGKYKYNSIINRE